MGLLMLALVAVSLPAQAGTTCVAASLLCTTEDGDSVELCAAQLGGGGVGCNYAEPDGSGGECTGVTSGQGLGAKQYGVRACEGSASTCVVTGNARCVPAYVPIPYLGCFVNRTPQVGTDPPAVNWCL